MTSSTWSDFVTYLHYWSLVIIWSAKVVRYSTAVTITKYWFVVIIWLTMAIIKD